MSCVADYRLVWVLLKMRRTLSLLLNDRLLRQWRQHQLSPRGYTLPLNTPPLLPSKCLNVSNIHAHSQGSQTAIDTSRNELEQRILAFSTSCCCLLYPGRLLLSFACIGVTFRGTLDNLNALACIYMDSRNMSRTWQLHLQLHTCQCKIFMCFKSQHWKFLCRPMPHWATVHQVLARSDRF